MFLHTYWASDFIMIQYYVNFCSDHDVMMILIELNFLNYDLITFPLYLKIIMTHSISRPQKQSICWNLFRQSCHGDFDVVAI